MLTGIRNFSAIMACWCILSAPAVAARLDDAACDALKVERARIETDALKSDMQKGPVWAKDNVSPERLKEIEQVISLEESIAFRCQQPKSVAVPVHATKVNPGAAGAGGAASEAGAALAPVDEEAAAATDPAPAGKKRKPVSSKKSTALTATPAETLPVEKPSSDKPKSKANKASSPKPAAKLQKSKSKAADAKAVDAYAPPAASSAPAPAQNPPAATGEASAERPGAALAP